MSKIRSALKTAAESRLRNAIAQISMEAKDRSPAGVEPAELLRLACGGRTDTLYDQVISRMIAAAEDALLKDMTNRAEPTADGAPDHP